MACPSFEHNSYPRRRIHQRKLLKHFLEVVTCGGKYKDLRALSKTVDVRRGRGNMKLDIFGKDDKRHRFTVVTIGMEGDAFHFALERYIGMSPEAWVREKGLGDHLPPPHPVGDFHRIRKIILEHAAAACCRLAEFST